MKEAVALTIDTLGRRCPVPVIELAKHIGDVAVGDVVEVLSDDEASRVDVPVWCRMKGHDYLGVSPAAVGNALRVRRRH
ncbi:MAG TPA: sulfurtransferase TusA family protein [Mycobacteriales bacterium]|nr:sulfurtransferase TusA family protein [Mycobacteriales bacterium]